MDIYMEITSELKKIRDGWEQSLKDRIEAVFNKRKGNR